MRHRQGAGKARGAAMTGRKGAGAYGRAAFAWAVKRGAVSVNPFAALPIVKSVARRERVLSDAELAEICAPSASRTQASAGTKRTNRNKIQEISGAPLTEQAIVVVALFPFAATAGWQKKPFERVAPTLRASFWKKPFERVAYRLLPERRQYPRRRHDHPGPAAHSVQVSNHVAPSIPGSLIIHQFQSHPHRPVRHLRRSI
jgi:hypothetical protein